ncbi:HAMP domain-containing sensor histidine kinase [Streptomyces sp. SP17BM10]|uniref:sensor histidine kinase n=1 Tax=Streptomyces sp. SP17BM10 TaxID=3002530 RepID=UPI002E78F4C5|nr:HAMP domain-containing sensor histidine kinase [Streptomyces sp. SP17BM10]MEE1783195.1 HAMP domain-containing sensor histidine kinase [Streptomyces sp. SP17BM10]
MTRRIVLALLVLSVVLVAAAAVPLGLSITERERLAFRIETQAAARVIAASAEEHLSDHESATGMVTGLAEAAKAGHCAAVYDAQGQPIGTTPCPVPPGPAEELTGRALKGQEPAPREVHGRLVAAEPVGSFRQPTGAVVLSRSTDPLDDRITIAWAWIGLVAAVGVAASALLSVRLARWVGRPLTTLDTAARHLGEGRLGERADVSGGPPEVRRLAATFNTMAARTEALIHGHQAVVADVSHQLRTPLAALRLRLDLLATAGPDSAPELLASAQDEVGRLSRLVDGLLAVARAEQTVPKPVAVPVDEVAAERVAAWEPVAQEKGIRLTFRGGTGAGPVVSLGPDALEQVLDNLLDNALDAVPDGGTVTVDRSRRPDGVRLRIVDDGPGMTPEARDQAFRRFGNTKARGTGLGLAIVHRLITANGGSIRLEDSPGGGLTVVIDLPLWRDADRAS